MFSVLQGLGDTGSQPVCHEAMVISLIVISKVHFSITCYLGCQKFSLHSTCFLASINYLKVRVGSHLVPGH